MEFNWDTTDPRWPDYKALFAKIYTDSLLPLVASQALSEAQVFSLGLSVAQTMNTHLLADNEVDPPVDPPGDGEMVMGLNFGTLAPWSSQRPTNDLMDRIEYPKTADRSGVAAVDSEGIPTEPWVATVAQGQYPLSISSLKLEGVQARGPAIVFPPDPEGNQPVEDGSKMEFFGDGEDSFPTARVVGGGHLTFNTEFIDPIYGTKVIRTAQWQNINRAKVALEGDRDVGFVPDWNNRNVSGIMNARNGAPLVRIAATLKEINAETWWVHMPITADMSKNIEYATQLGRWMKNNWDGEVIFEVSNEICNTQFPQNAITKQIGSGDITRGLLVLLGPCWEAFIEGYGAGAKIALMGWAGDVSFLSKFLASAPQTTLDMIEYGGCAGYFPGATKLWKSMADADPNAFVNYDPRQIIFDSVEENGERFEEGISAHATLCVQYGLKFASYEAGISIILGNMANIPGLAEAVIAAHETEQAGTLNNTIYFTLENAGCEIVCHFSYCRVNTPDNGVFGLYKDHQTPRQALLDSFQARANVGRTT